MENFKSPADALCEHRKRGYNTDFSTQTFGLYCGDLDMRLDPEDFKVDEEYRFGDDVVHEEDTVLVAITSTNGIKEVLVDTYWSYSEYPHFDPAKVQHCNTRPSQIN